MINGISDLYFFCQVGSEYSWRLLARLVCFQSLTEWQVLLIFAKAFSLSCAPYILSTSSLPIVYSSNPLPTHMQQISQFTLS